MRQSTAATIERLLSLPSLSSIALIFIYTSIVPVSNSSTQARDELFLI